MGILFIVFLGWFLISLLIYKLTNSRKRRLADVIILVIIVTMWLVNYQLVALMMLFVAGFNYSMATILYLFVSLIGAFLSRNLVR